MAAGDLGTTPRVAQVDWFRVTPDRTAPAFAADDEFDGTALDGCRWAESVRYNSNTESVADGHLKIGTEPGDRVSATVVNPRRDRSGRASYQSGRRVHGVLNTAPMPTLIERR